jgi:hypothetical protein
MNLRTQVVLILLSTITATAVAQSSADDPTSPQGTQARGYWVDPATKLMWAAKDNGKDVTWKQAMKYCQKLQIAGYSDWRLATLPELAQIYDPKLEAPGLAGYSGKQRAFTWHVKGNLFLTGDQWSRIRPTDDRGRPTGYAWHYDFNEGREDKDPTGWPYSDAGMRALCVRGSQD